MPFRMWLVLLLVFAVGAPLGAQTKPDGTSAVPRLRFGPVNLNPTVALTNAGVDDNVFNASDANAPKRDFTFTVTPRTDAWIRLGRAWVIGTVAEDFVYYTQFASERSVNGTYRGDVWLPLNRVTVRLGSDYVNTRDRPGYEIDARSRHTEGDVHASVDVRAFGKTRVAASVRRGQFRFEPDAVFLGRSLQRELNRSMTSSEIAIKHSLTPVTTAIATIEYERDRFDYSPVRDADSTRVGAGLKFAARIAGTATVGYRAFRPLIADVPGYDGATASVDMSVRPFGATRFGVQLMRDLDYSYDIDQPYYIESGGGVSITQGMYARFDAIGRIGIQQLSYQGRLSSRATHADRTDVIHWFGGGVGYRVGRDMRIGFNVEQQRRTSDLAVHAYRGMRYGTSVTYGF
jgi:hypothetical protein